MVAPRKLELDGETLSLAAAARKIGISPSLLDFRIKQHGWDLAKVMPPPPKDRLYERHGHASAKTPTSSRTTKWTDTYKSWIGMRQRCHDRNCRAYEQFGGRGIKVDPAWDSFTQFLADMGERPKAGPGIRHYGLARRDINKDYTKDNCYWQAFGKVSCHSDELWIGKESNTYENWANQLNMTVRELRNRVLARENLVSKLFEIRHQTASRRYTSKDPTKIFKYDGVLGVLEGTVAFWADWLGVRWTTAAWRLKNWPIGKVVMSGPKKKRDEMPKSSIKPPVKLKPDWNSYFMQIAQVVATRATCLRKHVGAVIVRDHVILATGYNGSVRGAPHCDDPGVGCLMEEGHCVRTVHAEVNAISAAAKNGVKIDGSVLYTTASPCWPCLKQMINAGIKQVFYYENYRLEEKVITEAKRAGVGLDYIGPPVKPD